MTMLTTMIIMIMTMMIILMNNSDCPFHCQSNRFIWPAAVSLKFYLYVCFGHFISERTKLVLKPQNQTVPEGSSVRLPCKASKDRSLELRYNWKKDGGVIADVSNIQWRETGYMLELSNLSFQDAGVYTCVAYTPEPRSSEDSVAVIVSIEGILIGNVK